MNRAMIVLASIAIAVVSGCGGDDSELQNKKQAKHEHKRRSLVIDDRQSEIVKEYRESLAKLLKIRKSRENLSYSVSSKVEEEMAEFMSLTASQQEKRLSDIKKQIEKYQ